MNGPSLAHHHVPARRYPAAGIEAWMARAFEGCGALPPAAAMAAAVLARTSLRGIDTHGIARMPAYLASLRSGATNGAARPRIASRGNLLDCDGQGGLGQLVASRAMDAAVAAARDTPVVACTVGNSGHMGALGMHALRAGEQGMIGIVCQRTPPIMALPGATGRAIGNNPIAFALPVAGDVPLVFDMACSQVARGNVADALRAGHDAIPAGWAIDAQGNATTDPAAALAGAMLPMAGHKGIGLAMLVECLAGSLSGADGADCAGGGQAGGSAGGAGAFILVINPDLVAGRSAFDAHVRGWTGRYLAAAGPAARYPGQRQARCEQERREHGIPVGAELAGELRTAGDAAGVPFDVAPLPAP